MEEYTALSPLKESLECQAKEAEIYPTSNQLSPLKYANQKYHKYRIFRNINLAGVCIVDWKRKLVQCRHEVVARGIVDQGRLRDGSKVSSLGD